ncbi:MAG TPA: hypothetical protein VGB84_00080 [Arachidicoccus sp.]
MRPFGRKIHWPTKVISNKHYISEVPVDGKKTSLFNFRLGYYDLYTAQVMRTGNCLTLLSTPPVFSLEIFKNTNLFDDGVKYIFWTFNAAYLIRLEKYLPTLSLEELKDSLSILQAHPEPYLHIASDEADEELIWCSVKNENLKKDSKFALMYEKDKKNRQEVLRIMENTVSASGNKHDNKPERVITSFVQMVNPVFDTVEKTLEYMQSKIIEAKFPHNIFRTIEKTKKGNNQTGLNSEIEAMVYFFQQKGYFKNEFTFKDVFTAFGEYTDNAAGKDYDYDFFVHYFRFEKYAKLLQSIEIRDFSSQ